MPPRPAVRARDFSAGRRRTFHLLFDPVRAIPRVIAAGVLATLAALSSSCGPADPAPQAPAAVPAAITWKEVGTWEGDGSRQTESFDVSPFAMRLRWQTTRETVPGAGRFTVSLHSAVSGRWLQTIVEARGATEGTVNVNDEPRWCHFVIDAANVEWRMTLEQGYGSDTR